MNAQKVNLFAKELLDPDAPAWSKVAPEKVHLAPTPVDTIPSKYINETTDPKDVGKIKNIEAKALHNGKEVFIRLEWEDPTKNVDLDDTRGFPDGVAMLFPLKGEAPLATMGSENQPVNAWFWRADFSGRPRNIVAAGLGTAEYTEKSPLVSQSRWKDGKWRVVVSRPLAVPSQAKETIQLKAGGSTKIGFAAWEGSNFERAGAKAYTTYWRNLALDA